ncbi:multidrug efflux SMR transporter [Kocuria sp. TGY1127_2]|uniref:DMT family transporter n=1 Tax=Kocuria sp. TGY1127_2 TaxID=2711328 RepID=UPI0015BF4F8D|nr:multidrug efflux SMR transporter [Kocuria sp. TGY1127_2]
MAWIILLVSAVLEAVWATALGESHGFTYYPATILFVIALIGSMGGLGWAVKTIPISTAYAIWTGIGAALTVVYGMLTGAESVSALKILCIVGIVGATVGLKLMPSRPAKDQSAGSNETISHVSG